MSIVCSETAPLGTIQHVYELRCSAHAPKLICDWADVERTSPEARILAALELPAAAVPCTPAAAPGAPVHSEGCGLPSSGLEELRLTPRDALPPATLRMTASMPSLRHRCQLRRPCRRCSAWLPWLRLARRYAAQLDKALEGRLRTLCYGMRQRPRYARPLCAAWRGRGTHLRRGECGGRG